MNAESFARNCLYRYKENLARLEQKQDILDTLSSRTVVNYGERSGSSYVESIPMWLERLEFLEEEIKMLRLIVNPITRLIADMPRELLEVWQLKFERGMSWKEAQTEAEISRNIFLNRYNRIIELAISYLGIS